MSKSKAKTRRKRQKARAKQRGVRGLVDSETVARYDAWTNLLTGLSNGTRGVPGFYGSPALERGVRMHRHLERLAQTGDWFLDMDVGVPMYPPKTDDDGPLFRPATEILRDARVRDYVRDPVVEAFVRRPPARVLRDLAFAELVLRDAIEEQSRTPAEVTDLMAIANDLRDELAPDGLLEAPVDSGPVPYVHNRQQGRATYDVHEVPWCAFTPTSQRRLAREIENAVHDAFEDHRGQPATPSRLVAIEHGIRERLRLLAVDDGVMVTFEPLSGRVNVELRGHIGRRVWAAETTV